MSEIACSQQSNKSKPRQHLARSPISRRWRGQAIVSVFVLASIGSESLSKRTSCILHAACRGATFIVRSHNAEDGYLGEDRESAPIPELTHLADRLESISHQVRIFADSSI